MTPLARVILDWITQHPGRTAEEIQYHFQAEYLDDDIFNAIYWLVFHLHVARDPRTSALTANMR